ncbi:transcriptional regulator, ArsR family [Natronincola peptidivorans]|uniref:Transcriptional regulator, ArsR family n=1 Tax=Natronincola peptidivorans TaxID=426128 RepID=A0A1I0D8A9_9FIRM|nr:metalloregulator ArsR/SmtB family transcription factor [Natronincola peptidivorans]SET28126.1 transcriptional regulator, ArsR family [Natronincola peptidivorans]
MKKYVEIFKALSDENRLKILLMLTYGELCANDIQEQLELTQPTISHHMKVLQKADLIRLDRRGKWMYYAINSQKAHELCKLVQEITTVCEARGCGSSQDCYNQQMKKE